MTFSYSAANDPFPHQAQPFNKLYPFYDYLRQGRLVTTGCRECGKITWPPKSVCPECASGQMDWTDLPKEGAVVAYTIAERGIPSGFSIPTIFVLVQMGPVRILSRLVDADPGQVSTGAAVWPDVVRVPGTPFAGERVLPVFRLKTAAGPSADNP